MGGDSPRPRMPLLVTPGYPPTPLRLGAESVSHWPGSHSNEAGAEQPTLFRPEPLLPPLPGDCLGHRLSSPQQPPQEPEPGSCRKGLGAGRQGQVITPAWLPVTGLWPWAEWGRGSQPLSGESPGSLGWGSVSGARAVCSYRPTHRLLLQRQDVHFTGVACRGHCRARDGWFGELGELGESGLDRKARLGRRGSPEPLGRPSTTLTT